MPRLLLLLIVTLAAGALLFDALPSRPAEAAFPGANGKIAFVSDRDEIFNREVYVMNGDGSDVVRLTHNSGVEFNPAWSPDGEWIAYFSQRDIYAQSGLYVMRADGTDAHQLTTGDSDYFPAWSPDGKQVAFYHDRQIWTVNSDGSDERQLTSLPQSVEVPSWSPDGKRIAVSRIPPGIAPYQIYVVDAADGSNATNLSNSKTYDTMPAWSPDGREIAFVRGDGFGGEEIFKMNADGSNQTQLTDDEWMKEWPKWSPDGTKIVFSRFADDVLVMDADGSNQVDLTNLPGLDEAPDWQPLAVEGLSGDLDCNGILNSLDATLALRLGAAVGTPARCKGQGDANHDGRVDAIDAALILQYTAGLLDHL